MPNQNSATKWNSTPVVERHALLRAVGSPIQFSTQLWDKIPSTTKVKLERSWSAPSALEKAIIKKELKSKAAEHTPPINHLHAAHDKLTSGTHRAYDVWNFKDDPPKTDTEIHGWVGPNGMGNEAHGRPGVPYHLSSTDGGYSVTVGEPGDSYYTKEDFKGKPSHKKLHTFFSNMSGKLLDAFSGSTFDEEDEPEDE